MTDRAGNPLGADDRVINFVVRDASIVWVNPFDGFWDDPANWDAGVVPTATDDVLIDVVGNPTITFRSGTVQVRSLIVRDALTLTGGTLSVEQNFDLEATMTLNGGTLSNSTIDVEANSIITTNTGTLSGVTVNGDLDLSASNAWLRIEGGTTFTTAHLKGNYSRIGFAPGSVLSGTILFEGSNTGVRWVDINHNSGTLTIGPTGVIRTTSDFAGSARIEPVFGSGGSMTLVNQGTISSQTSGRTVRIGPGSFTNSGTLEALNGGTLNVNGLTGNLNTVTLAGLSTVTLGSFRSNVNNLGLSVATGQTLTLNGTWSSTGAINVNGGTLNLVLVAGGGAVTIGPSGAILTTSDFSGSAQIASDTNSNDITLVNQGTIRSQTSGRAISINVNKGFTNLGLLESLNGGMLSVSNLADHTGAIKAGAGSTVTINGPFTQLSTGRCRCLILMRNSASWSGSCHIGHKPGRFASSLGERSIPCRSRSSTAGTRIATTGCDDTGSTPRPRIGKTNSGNLNPSCVASSCAVSPSVGIVAWMPATARACSSGRSCRRSSATAC